jgi:outer membrane protein assembly factor BamB
LASGVEANMHGGGFKGHVGGVRGLGDIFRSLSQDRQSGTLTVIENRRSKKIYFDQGSITLLSSTKRIRIGELLVSTGKITEDDLELAIKLQKQSRNRLGEILVEEGFCDEEDIRRIVRYQVEGEIYDCFLWANASYEFQPGVKPEELQGGNRDILRLDIDTNALVIEALHRMEEWHNSIRPLVPTTKEIYVPTGRTAEGMGLPEKLIDIFPKIAGQHSVQQLAEMAQLSDFEICKHFATLVKMGILRPLSLEELVKKSDEAYATNDFATTVTLYSRLEESYPEDMKIILPLADALRQTEAIVDAMPLYEKVAAHLQQEGDQDGLKRCWTTMYNMDPNRHDLFQLLQAMEAKVIQARQQKKRLIPILIFGTLVILLVAGNVAIILAGQRKKALDLIIAETITNKLLALKELKKNEDWSGAHAAGLSLLKDYGELPLAKDLLSNLLVPITIKTQPSGFNVFINDVQAGATSQITSMVIAEYDPRKGLVQLKLTKGAKKKPVTFKILSGGTEESDRIGFEPLQFHEVKVAVSGQNRWSQLGEARFTGRITLLPLQKKYVVASREGRLYTMDMDGTLGSDPVTVGSYGDVISAVTVSEDQAFVGLTVGGVKRVEVTQTPLPTEETYPAGAPVHGAPLVTKAHVIFGCYDGYIYIYQRGGVLVSKIEGAGYFPHRGILRNRGKEAIFAGSDGYLRCIDVFGGKEKFRVDLGRTPTAAPIDCGGSVSVLLEGGVAAITSSSVVSEPVFIRNKGAPPFDLAGDAKTLIFASQGQVQAFAVGTQKAIWKEPFKSEDTGQVHVGLLKDRVLFGPGQRLIYALNRENGQLLWRGDLGKSTWITSEFSIFDDHFLVVLRGRAIGKLTPFYGR